MNPKYPWDIRTSGDLLSDPETSATVLHTILLTAYGADGLYGDDAMDPVALWMEAEEDFRCSIPPENENKVQALMTGLSTDMFYYDDLAFRGISLSLSEGDLGDMVEGAIEDPELPEILWAAFEVELNRDEAPEFEPRVLKVIEEAISEEGVNADLAEAYVDEKKEDLFNDLRRLGVEEQVIRRLASGN